jgi:sterol desaturase/sphingolipid hydroxylase (fatty acid hydroxylase superfamily)
MGKIIVLATPLFLALIAVEFWWSRKHAKGNPSKRFFSLSDSINSISLGMLSQLSGALSKLLVLGLYTAAFEATGNIHMQSLWSGFTGFVLALVFYDFCYYWLHRAGHEVAVLWAAHVVHHQSQHYNLSTALRQTSSGAWLGWIFYLPMALAGVPPTVFALVGLVDLLYQFWVHTEQIGKLGWFDRIFCSPSNHRVHHAVNDGYVDRNYGGILVVWDRLFGSFQKEQEPCVYGTRSPLQSWDPMWANAEVYWALLNASFQARQWRDKLRVWFKPPGWQSAAMARTSPQKPFSLASVTNFDPPLTRSEQVFAMLQFAIALGAVAWLLWNMEAMPWPFPFLLSAGVSVVLWLQGRYLQHRVSAAKVLALELVLMGLLGLSGLTGLAGF